MASVTCRSPRPASGSSAKASAASVRSPRSAASTVSSWVATWRRTISSYGVGQRAAVAAADAVAVDDADRLDHRVRRQADGLTGVGDVHRGLEGLAREHGLDHGRRQLARLPGLQVLGAGQPGVDVGDVVRLVLLAPRNRAELNVVGRAPVGLGREGERDELGNVPVAGRREGAPALEQRQLEEVPLGEVELGERLGLRAPRVRGQRRQAADLLDQIAQHVEAVRAVDLERGEHREVVDPGHRGRDRLEGPAQGDGQVHAEVAHLVTEADRLDAGLAAHGAGQRRHGVGDVEEPGVRAALLHRLADADEDGDVAQGAVDAARSHGVPHRLGDAVGGRHVEVHRHGAEAAGRDAHDDEVGAVERRMEVGGGGDRRLGAHGLVQLVGQRLHFRQRRGVDVLEHEVHAGERRRPEEVGHQLRAPLIASAADDRHLGRHAATVQSRSWFASDVAPRWRSPPPSPPAAIVHLVRPQAFASIMPRAIPEEHHTNLIYASGVVELVCAVGLVRRTRWASRRQPGHPGGRVPGQHPDGARCRDGAQPRPVGQPRRRLGPPPPAAGHGLGGAPGAPRPRD